MSMSAITVNDWAGMNGSTESLSFLLPKDSLDSFFTSNTQTLFGSQSQKVGSDPITETDFANGLGNAGLNPEPDVIMGILSAALYGGGMTAVLPGLDQVMQATAVAERLYRGDPLKARALVAQIVTACVAAG
jgi:hypothetical protein